MNLVHLNKRLVGSLDAALDTIDRLRAENDALRDMLDAERADRDEERREADAALSWGEAA